MIRAVFFAAAIALGATGTVTLHDGINGCCTTAHAQTKIASPEPTIWDHNGSVMYFVENGLSREFHYQKPRPGMLEAGARSGSLLFRGQVDNGQYVGTAYIFNPRCGQIPFQVKGPVLDNDERIVLTGQAPQVGRHCRIDAFYTTSLEFKRLNPVEAGQSQEPTRPPDIEDIKPQVPSQVGGELATAPAAQPPVAKENPSAAHDAPRNVAERPVAGTPAAEPSVTNTTPSTTKGLDISGVTFVVMIASLLSFTLLISLRKDGFRRK
jgi:hypothetical protein